MKRFALFTAAMFLIAGVTTAFAQQTPPKPTTTGPTKPKTATAVKPKPAPVTLPAAVDAAFKKAYPNATIKNTSKETENGQEQYEIESVDGSTNRDLIYKPDGTLVEYEEMVPAADVPTPVMTAIKTRYPKATVGTCAKLFKDNAMNYEIALKNHKPGEVVLTPDGTWVTPPKAK